MNGLRARLMAVTALVVGVAVAALALFSGRVVQNEYRELVRHAPVRDLGPAERALNERGAAQGTLEGSDALLARLAPATGHELVVVDGAGRIVASSNPAVRGGRIAFGPGDLVTVTGPAAVAHGAREVGMELFGAERVELHAADGRAFGTLVVLPPAPAERRTAPFLRSVGRGLWIGGLGALALGLALVWLLSGRIVGPVEALTAAARRLEGGDLSARVEVRGRDEVAELARAFNAMAEALARSRAQRRQLTSDIAHELRTPLTNLRAQIEALQDGLMAPDAAGLRSLHEETLLLARLVDDLQELALADAGALRLDRVRVVATEALESSAAAMRARAAERDVIVTVEGDASLGVTADRDRLAQILRNLLDNALTVTPQGGQVTLSAGASGALVELSVADTGPGIPPEHLPHVFERFYRVDPSRTRATGGAGLGLAIVRHLVEAQGGTVAVASAPGGGARFAFTLPRG
jgi:two-component system sensor histidine kinase BaeS